MNVLSPQLSRRSRFHPRSPGVRAQHRRLGRRDHDEVGVLLDVVRDAVEAVDPHRAHRARLRLRLAVHEVVHDQRAVGPGEQLAQPHLAHRVVAGIEIAWAFEEHVVVHDRARRQRPAHRGDALPLLDQLDLGPAQLLPAAYVVVALFQPGELGHGHAQPS